MGDYPTAIEREIIGVHQIQTRTRSVGYSDFWYVSSNSQPLVLPNAATSLAPFTGSWSKGAKRDSSSLDFADSVTAYLQKECGSTSNTACV